MRAQVLESFKISVKLQEGGIKDTTLKNIMKYIWQKIKKQQIN